MINFIARVISLEGVVEIQLACDIRHAFDVAYMLQNSPTCVEFKCMNREYQAVSIPGTAYIPQKLVESFTYTKLKP